MKILITGHMGFIGSHLVRVLGKKNKIAGCDIKLGKGILDAYWLEKDFEHFRPDVVIHCAALTGVRASEKWPKFYWDTNVIGTENVLGVSELFNVKHLIFFSSSSVYDGQSYRPKKEDSKKGPVSIYGMSKLVGEMLCKRSKVNTTVVRPFSVYGEHGRADQVIMKWISQLKKGEPCTFYGNGQSGRGYTYIGDLVDGVERVLHRRMDSAYDEFNLGGKDFVTLEELRDIFSKQIREGIVWKTLPLPDTDVRFSWADTSKAEVELQWRPRAIFAQKIRQIIKEEIKS